MSMKQDFAVNMTLKTVGAGKSFHWGFWMFPMDVHH
jgi:hypothetical protein